jgi:hypothetical protein
MGATLDLLVPAAPALAGASVFAQVLVVDPMANLFGASLSNGGTLRIGAP